MSTLPISTRLEFVVNAYRARSLRRYKSRLATSLDGTLLHGFSDKEARQLEAYLKRVEINLKCLPADTGMAQRLFPGSIGDVVADP